VHAGLLDEKSQAKASAPIADSTASIVENAFHKGKPSKSFKEIRPTLLLGGDVGGLFTWHTGKSTGLTANLNHRQGPEHLMETDKFPDPV
jgi:hypothetical protein